MYKQSLLMAGMFLAVLGLAAADLPPEENRMRADHMPTPFSSEELKAFNVPGYETTYRIEATGRDPIIARTRWLPSEEGLAVFVSQQMNAAGEPVGEPQRASSDWKELQSHASFPAAATEISIEEIEVPAGQFTCWRYDVKRQVPIESGPPKSLVMTFWFARELPGPPVMMQHRLDGEVTMTMSLVSHQRPE